MNFDALQRRVRRAEAVVQVRMDETVQHWDALETTWRRSWTPGRIVIAGLAGGFVAGRLEPGGAFSGARWLQMIGSVSGLVASAQASIATLQEAGLAAAAAAAGAATGEAAAHADDDAPAPRPQAVAEPPPGTPPRAAEAATELSES
ncbi:protein sip-5 [Stenotrophomonas nitritireducens]|uniref:protein sip-5 n=1 Tax=Stenotrophomonas nitritireducens TaxID=83617 RepID=UPI003D9A0402